LSAKEFYLEIQEANAWRIGDEIDKTTLQERRQNNGTRTSRTAVTVQIALTEAGLRSIQLGTHDRYERDHLARVSPEIVHDGELAVIGDSPVLGRLASQLEPALVVHP
jgi:hypothetical protein